MIVALLLGFVENFTAMLKFSDSIRVEESKFQNPFATEFISRFNLVSNDYRGDYM